MAQKVTCFVTNSEEGRGAFAVRADNDETVYVPQKIAEALQLEEFDELLAIVVKNERPETPWMAIRVRRLGEDVAEG